MPYNPQVSNQVGDILSRSIEQGKSRLFQALMWSMQQADETKSLRSQLDTIDPEGKDDHKNMSKGEMQGKIVGLHLKDQMQTGALDTALKTAQLGRVQSEAGSESAMSAAMRQALPQTTTSTTDLRGQPAGPGNPFTVQVPSRPRMTPNDLMTAIAQNPAAINSPAGRQAVNDWMRNNPTTQGGPPQFTQGPDGTNWAYNQKTGQFEPSPIDKINATAAAKAAAKGPERQPGAGPTLSKDNKFYWDQHLQAWKPLAAGKADLFNTDGGAGPPVSYRWENGQLIRATQ